MVLLRTRKSVLELAASLKAKDLTDSSTIEIEKFMNREYEDPFSEDYHNSLPPLIFLEDYTPIACSVGVYGVNSLLIRNKTGEFGYISKRNSLLYLLL